MKITTAITAVECFLPDYVLTNAELEKIVDTSDEWIRTRTGISERRILKGKGLGTSDMGAEAVKKILEKKNLDPNEIDMLIVGTVTGDYVFPATANIICEKVGAKKAWGYDINAACSGFLFALQTASKFIESGTYKKVIVVGADKMSSITNYQDRNTCILFGDAGGAVLLEPNTEGLGILDACLYSDGMGRPYLYQKSGGSVSPPTLESVQNREHFVYQEGQTVFKFAVVKMAEAAAEIMERNHLSADDVAYLIPHQANLRIIQATADRMGIGKDKVIINIQKYGNTTSATIPICLAESQNLFKKGDNIILAAFGGGFTWGSIYLKWAY